MSAAEFILEGLHAHKRIGRSEERVFKAGEKKPEPAAGKSLSSPTRSRTGREGSLTNCAFRCQLSGTSDLRNAGVQTDPEARSDG